MKGSQEFFASFAVGDLAHARSFYRDVLGMQVDAQDGFMELRRDGGKVLVYAKPDHRPADFTVLNFEVPDIRAAVSELAGKGVRFERYGEGPLQTDADGIHRDEMATIAWFKDPSGNFLSVIETAP
ncbi:MAG TPA: VOC family protein [Xanthomonadaceae bacterium]|nr:VOC family protein [Xanthomonadaceae bacterium]